MTRGIRTFIAVFLPLACALLLSPGALAQLGEPQVTYRNYSVEDGLPSSETYCVHQDRQGYIWVATDRGVARFDGYKFQVYTTDDGLTDNVVFGIYEDPKGRIWFVTYNSMLCYFENNRIVPYKYNHLIKKQQGNKVVDSKNIVIGSNGDVYLSLMSFEVFKISAAGKLTKLQRPEGVSLVKEPAGWVVTDVGPGGLSLMKPELYLNGKKWMHLGRGQRASAIVEVGKRPILYASGQLIDVLRKRIIYTEERSVSLYCFQLETSGRLLMGTREGLEVAHYDSQKQRLTHFNTLLKNKSVSFVIRSLEGGYWVTTLQHGLFYIPNLDCRNYTLDEGLMDNLVYRIAGIQNNVYAGYYNARFQQLNAPWNRYEQQEGLLNVCRIFTGNNRFYFSFLSVDWPQLKAFEHYDLPGRNYGLYPYQADYWIQGDSILTAGRDILLFRNNQSHVLLNTHDKKRKAYGSRFECLMVDAQGTIWAGGYGRLCKVVNDDLDYSGLQNPLFNTRVVDLNRHPRWGNIAITRGEGVFFFNGTKVTGQVTMDDGLLSNQLSSLFVDANGGIWIGSNEGLNYLTRAADGKITVRRFTRNHGLISNEVMSVYAWNGKVWVATKNGLSVFRVSDMRAAVPSKVYFSYLETQARRWYAPQNNFTFAYDEPLITVGFRTTNYKQIEKRLYRYHFHATGKWQETAIPELTLNNPSAGEYELELSYRNEDGSWSEPVAICAFTIEAPLWRRWYFIVFCVIVGAAIIYTGVRIRIRQSGNKHRLHMKINQLEQKALRAQMNPHFIFNSLNSIQSFLIYEENEKAERYLLKFAHLIRQTLNNSRESYITLAEEISTLQKYLELEQMRFKDKFSFEIVSKLTVDELAFGVPPMLIQPYVENAVLHGFSNLKTDGRIEVIFSSIVDNRLKCVVRDNGVGRKATFNLKKSNGHKSFGTTITTERLEAFREKYGEHFSVEIVDLEGTGETGTMAVLHIPVVPPTEMKQVEAE